MQSESQLETAMDYFPKVLGEIRQFSLSISHTWSAGYEAILVYVDLQALDGLVSLHLT